MGFSHSHDLGLVAMLKQEESKVKGYKHYQINLAVNNFLALRCLIASKVEYPDTAGYIYYYKTVFPKYEAGVHSKSL
jgi:hypothetical protein